MAVLDANAYVEPQTETVWRQGDKYSVPRMVFVNKMDKIGADFYNCEKMMVDRLGNNTIGHSIANRRGKRFCRCCRFVENEGYYLNSENLGATYQEEEIPADLVEKAQQYREKLIETAVEVDDAAMEAYLEGNEPDMATLKVYP